MSAPRSRGYSRVIPVLTIALLILTSLPWSPVAARQSPENPTLELPALSLTPPQLTQSGMPGYMLIGGQLVGPGHLTYLAGKWTDQITNDDIQETLEGFGLQRAYKAALRSQQNPDEIRGDLARDLELSLHEFSDVEGATQGLALIDQLSAAYSKVQRVEGTGPITANAVLVRLIPPEGKDWHVLSVAWQVDRLIIVVTIIDYLQTDPTAQDAEAIAALMTQGIQAGLTGGTPGLGNMAVRLKDVDYDELFEIRRDEYSRIGGQDFGFAQEEAAVTARRVAAAGDALDAYAFNQFIRDVEAVDPSLPFQFGWVTRLYRFADDQAASAWLQAHAGRIEQSYAGSGVSVQDLQIVEDAPVVGDESVSVTYVEQDDSPGRIVRTSMRVGNRTADIFLTSFLEEPFPDETIETLAAIQAQCLATGCPEPMLISDALAGQLPNTPPAAGTLVPGGQETVDLGTMPLTPADLDALQMPGYGVGFGQMTYPDEFIASMTERRGLPEEQVRAQVEGSGFVRRYDSQLYWLADASAPDGTVGRLVASYVIEFTEASGAASAFDFLEDESANLLAADVPLSVPLGDRSEATHETGSDPVTGQSFDQIDVTFQSERFHAGVAIIDVQGQTVQLADVEKLAQRLLTRLHAGSTSTSPGLSGMVLRLSGAVAEPYSDQYLLVGGEAIPQYGESTQDLQQRGTTAASIGQTDEYVLQQTFAAGSGASDADAWYMLHLMRFSDAPAAINWMAGIPGRLSSNTAFTNVVFLPGPVTGNESVAYTMTTTDGTTGYRGIAFRVDNDVVLIDVTSPNSTNPLLLLALADAQATCLEATTCAAPFVVPPGLR